jgi:cell division protein ZapA
MATISLTIAGRAYELACRAGGEARLKRVAAVVDAKANDAARAMGGMSEARQMLFAALMVADELEDARAALAAQAATSGDDAALTIERLADRIERLATMLDAPGGVETSPANA